MQKPPPAGGGFDQSFRTGSGLVHDTAMEFLAIHPDMVDEGAGTDLLWVELHAYGFICMHFTIEGFLDPA
ncbi:MAG: hypothetical protein KDB95_14175, partial [Flavobacteriales bacterium]|nr:hypothetical protein [Flavobacteriales bacterium]